MDASDGTTYSAPERAPLLVYQSVGPRVVAGVIDAIIFILLDFLVCLLAGIPVLPDADLPLPVLIGLPASGFLYFLVCESLCGTTVGKRLFGMTVCRTDGGRASFVAVTVRTAALLVDALPYLPPFLLGGLCIARSRQRQRLGDRWAGTVVVSRDALRLGRPVPSAPSPMLRHIQSGDPAYDQPDPARPGYDRPDPAGSRED